VVRRFRRRRKWRHVLAIIAGTIALILGTAIVAARLAHQQVAGTPSSGAGAGLYVAGALVCGWGGAGGFTRRLEKWLPATLILGLLAVLGFVVAAVLWNEGDAVISNGQPHGGSTRTPVPPSSPPNSSQAAGRVLAAELLDRDDIEQLLGSAQADLQTPGATVARTRSLAIWRAISPGMGGGSPRGARLAAVSLTVQYSARQAGRLCNGHCPRGARPVAGLAGGLAGGGYVRHHDGSSGRVTRVRAGQGDWVVALQLRGAAEADPLPLLVADVRHMLDLLTAASLAMS
jgi:hypothetical protein